MPSRKARKLTLTTASELRDTVVIDDVEYEVKNPGEFSLSDIEELLRLGKLWDELEASETLEDDAHAQGFIRLVRRMLTVVFLVPLPDEVFDKLTMPNIQELGDFLYERWQEATSRTMIQNQARNRSAR